MSVISREGPAVLLLTLLLATPLCGESFGCGCDWLWNGLFSHCNSLHGIRPSCPWCEHFPLGIASILMPILGGIGFAWTSRWVGGCLRFGSFPAPAVAETAVNLTLGALGVIASLMLLGMLTPLLLRLPI